MLESSYLLAGIAAAMLHVLAGPDHLAAVAPFAIERVKRAWKVGFLWGVGHLAGMLIIGFLFLLFKDLIPVEKISEYSEKFVGVLLILLGVWILFKVYRITKSHKHVHIHADEEGQIHDHEHIHENEEEHEHKHEQEEAKKGYISTFFIGLVHGLAGVAHFLVFLPLLGFESKFQGVQYIIGFGIGTLLSMTAFAFVMGQIAYLTKKDHNEKLFKGMRIASAIFAIVFGIYWMLAN
ncbi:MAG: sulfite exporter TauE/SafE family protein [Tenacibaculum sp.]|nr:sulfite exporter TauE/SafE family protein [Tenacibaculum sp.]